MLDAPRISSLMPWPALCMRRSWHKANRKPLKPQENINLPSYQPIKSQEFNLRVLVLGRTASNVRWNEVTCSITHCIKNKK